MKRFGLEVGMAWCRVTEGLASTLNVAPTLEGLSSAPFYGMPRNLIAACGMHEAICA